MSWGWISVVGIVSSIFGFGLGFLWNRALSSKKLGVLERDRDRDLEEISRLQDQLKKTQSEADRLRTEEAVVRTELKQERRVFEEKLQDFKSMEKQFIDQFKALSSDALKASNESFLTLAKSTLEKFQVEAKGDLEKRQQAIESFVRPVKDSLEKVDRKIGDLEKAREGAYSALNQQVKDLINSQNHLKTETANLSKALRSPVVRGRWGEIQLKRVVEMAGMLDHCDFFEQKTAESDEGNRIRPDLIVQLPGEKTIVVDAKAALSAYIEATEAQDENVREERLKQHAQQIRTHISQLGRKSYWDQFSPSPEFVVLFLPGETFFSAALEQDPGLIEYGVDQKVIVATPTTLIALLRAVAYGWRQENLAESAQQIAELGKEIYKRISDMVGHFSKVGRSLSQAVESYNKTIGSLDSRVLVSARKFKELEVAGVNDEIPELKPIEQTSREPHTPDLFSS